MWAGIHGITFCFTYVRRSSTSASNKQLQPIGRNKFTKKGISTEKNDSISMDGISPMKNINIETHKWIKKQQRDVSVKYKIMCKVLKYIVL